MERDSVRENIEKTRPKLCPIGAACIKERCRLWVSTQDLEGECTFKALGHELFNIGEKLEQIQKRLQELRIKG